jgi:hypothetical protein
VCSATSDDLARGIAVVGRHAGARVYRPGRARACAGLESQVDPTFIAGAEAFCQYWSRDPLSASTTSLSNAVRMLINP